MIFIIKPYETIKILWNLRYFRETDCTKTFEMLQFFWSIYLTWRRCEWQDPEVGLNRGSFWLPPFWPLPRLLLPSCCAFRVTHSKIHSSKPYPSTFPNNSKITRATCQSRKGLGPPFCPLASLQPSGTTPSRGNHHPSSRKDEEEWSCINTLWCNIYKKFANKFQFISTTIADPKFLWLSAINARK